MWPLNENECDPPVLEYESVPVSDGGFVPVFVSRYILVEVGEAAGRRLGDVAKLVPRYNVGLQVVCQRALKRRRRRRKREGGYFRVILLF